MTPRWSLMLSPAPQVPLKTILLNSCSHSPPSSPKCTLIPNVSNSRNSYLELILSFYILISKTCLPKTETLDTCP